MELGAKHRGQTFAGVDAQRLQAILDSLDSEVRAAIGDVDRSLIRLSLAQAPRDRLRSSSNMMLTLMRLRRARTSASG